MSILGIIRVWRNFSYLPEKVHAYIYIYICMKNFELCVSYFFFSLSLSLGVFEYCLLEIKALLEITIVVQ